MAGTKRSTTRKAAGATRTPAKATPAITGGGDPGGLSSTPTPPNPPPPQGAPVGFPACSPPDTRTGPQFVVPLRRPLVLSSLAQPTGIGIACLGVTALDVSLGLDARFEQTWNLTDLSIGDLSSTMSLAPGEQLTIEVQTSQRKMLDQESVDSSESTTSTESTTADKEAVNVTRASSKTDNWHVDTSGTLTCGWATLNASAGYARSVTESNRQSIDRVTETTKKSAQSLKTLHKIQVRGVTETLVTNRMTRVVRNPYPDRTMSVNVFQMLKHFSVATALTETRLGVILRVDGLDFGADFVLANTDFLRAQLLDSAMIDDLPDATKGAHPPVSTDTLKQAGLIAQRALYHLFENTTMFNMPNVAGQDPNSPATSFNARITGNFLDSGLGDALSNHLEYEFATLSFYNQLYQDPAFVPKDFNNAIALATTLASEIGSKFTTTYPDLTKDPGDTDLRQIMDEHQFTEVFRRVPGFLAMVNGMLVPLLDPVKQEQADLKARQNANLALGRLLQHLKCNQHYYIQQYLEYIYAKTSGQAIIDFANSALVLLDSQSLLPSFLQLSDLDVDRTFIDRQRIVVPGLNPLTAQQLSMIGTELFGSGGTVVDPVPSVLDLEVPADGIHLEVAEGACVLANVPPPNTLSVGFDVQNAKLSVTQ